MYSRNAVACREKAIIDGPVPSSNDASRTLTLCSGGDPGSACVKRLESVCEITSGDWFARPALRNGKPNQSKYDEMNGPLSAGVAVTFGLPSSPVCTISQEVGI